MGENYYSEKLKNPFWQKKRLEILQRDEFKCISCGDNESSLSVHHVIYEKNKEIWDYDNILLRTLCESCHNDIHNRLKEIDFVIRYHFGTSDKLLELERLLRKIMHLGVIEINELHKDLPG